MPQNEEMGPCTTLADMMSVGLKNMVVKQDIIFMKKDYGLLLIAVEEDRIAGRNGCTLDGPDMYLDNVSTEV